MKVRMIFLMIILMVPVLAKAELIRIYCRPDGVTFETREDGQYNSENKIMPYDFIVIDDGQIPQNGSRDQFRCKGDSLIVDETIKTPAILKQEQITQAQAALDAELGKAEPDVITVMRLQRAIEKIKKGEIQQ